MSALEKLESPYLEGELQFVIPPNELSNKLAHALTESPFANLLVSLRAAESGAGLGERELEDWPAGEEAAQADVGERADDIGEDLDPLRWHVLTLARHPWRAPRAAPVSGPSIRTGWQ